MQGLQRHSAFLRLGKITKGPESALIAARHNLRELPRAPHIVEGKQSSNYVLKGPNNAVAVQTCYEVVLASHGISKLRKDAVRLIEAIVSLPVGIDDPDHEYFEAALQWLATEFGQANILSAVIHKDEAAQHMHVLIIPLIEGRMRGADLMGGPGILRDRHARFVSCMQQPWAQLNVAVQQPLRLRKTAMVQEVLDYLKFTNDPMWKSRVAQVIRDCIEANPETFYLTLGLAQRDSACPTKLRRRPRAAKLRTMAQIFTRPIKGMCGVKAERYRQSNEYLRAHVVAPPRKSLAAVTSVATTVSSNVQRVQHKRLALAMHHVPALAQLAMPRKPTRTLCSVGFVAAPIWIYTHLAVVAVTVQRNEAVASKEGVEHSDHRIRYGGQLIRQFTKLCRTLALQAKLLHWWLLKARIH